MTLNEMFVASQSSLQDFVDCQRRFELRYLLRQAWPAPEVGDWADFEKHMHDGEILHKTIHQHIVGIPADLLLIRLSDANVKQWFQLYLDKIYPTLSGKRYPEYMLTVPFGEYALMAKYDLVMVKDGKFIIYDWKTNQRMPKQTTVAKRLQTIVYRYVLAMGGSHLNGGEAIAPEQIEMRYWFAEHDGREITFTYDADMMKRDEAYLHGLLEQIQGLDTFELTDDENKCNYCVYRSLCNRGDVAGIMEQRDEDDIEIDEFDFDMDIDQIAEIEF